MGRRLFKPAPPDGSQTLSRTRLWLFRVLAIGLTPVLMASLEFGLRLGRFGFDPSFMSQESIGGATSYVDNRSFGLRFFPEPLNRGPIPFVVPVDKGRDECRIVVLGASAARGVPNHTFGFSRILQLQLQHRYPRTKFRIVNTGITAINSHVVREIAEDCLDFTPDLMVVYLGNNEVVGPFGAGTVFAPFVRSLSVIRASLWFKQSRISQLIALTATAMRPREGPQRSWRGMEMFLEHQVRRESPDLEVVYRHFDRNLRSICSLAAKHQVPVMLCTVAVNVKDSPPFASQHRVLTPEKSSLWDDWYEAGIEHEDAARFTDAVDAYQRALSVDDGYADLHFRLAVCYLQLRSTKLAKVHFNLAKEFDTLRFRADDRINSIIRTVADTVAGVTLVDVEAAICDASEVQLPGAKHFYEHVHFNFSGNYIVASMLTEAAHDALPQQMMMDGEQSLLDLAECKARLAFTDWHACQDSRDVIENYLKRPPFTNQLYYDVSMKRREHAVRAFCDDISDADLRRMDAEYRRYITMRSNDPWLRFNYAQFKLEAMKDYRAAVVEFNDVRQAMPRNPQVLASLGAAHLQLQETQQAVWHLQAALRIRPDMLTTRANLARALAADNQLPAAIEQFRRAIASSRDSATLYHELARLFIAQQDHARAIETLKVAIEIHPDDLDAYHLLGAAYVSQNRTDKAIDSYRATVRIRPDFVAGHNNLGSLYHQQGDFEKAITHFQLAIQYAPAFAPAHFNLGNTFLAKGEVARALDEFRKTVRLDPQFQPAHTQIVTLLHKLGRDHEARAYEQSVQRPAKP